jgi:hypothetical protein
MNLGKMFGRSGNAGGLGLKKVNKRSRVEGGNLKGALDKDYKRVSSRTVLPTKSVCGQSLSCNGLQEDFITMVQKIALYELYA